MEEQEKDKIYKEFRPSVNMTADQLGKWLKTDESKSVGWDSGDGESIGHKSGAHIIKILEKKKADLTTADYKHMQKVHGYIARHNRRKNLMNLKTRIGTIRLKTGATISPKNDASRHLILPNLFVYLLFRFFGILDFHFFQFTLRFT